MTHQYRHQLPLVFLARQDSYQTFSLLYQFPAGGSGTEMTQIVVSRSVRRRYQMSTWPGSGWFLARTLRQHWLSLQQCWDWRPSVCWAAWWPSSRTPGHLWRMRLLCTDSLCGKGLGNQLLKSILNSKEFSRSVTLKECKAQEIVIIFLVNQVQTAEGYI